jgi:protein-S-isoprenylcysteine O-methyltransferase Ste14
MKITVVPIINALLRCIVAAAITALLLFLPAGTVDYPQAWAFVVLFSIPMLLIALYISKNSPELLKRRLKTRESSLVQNILAKTFYTSIGLSFVISGLDKRCGWSSVPPIVCIAAGAVFLAGYFLLFLVFRENKYLAHTVRTEEGQEVVTTGPYAVVRHPMYFSEFIMFVSAPLVLGSYWAIAASIPLLIALVIRIATEEKVLLQGLAGYREYMQKTKYRLILGIW